MPDNGDIPSLFTGFIWVLIAYLCGSLPFSVWLGKGILKKDVRQYGDGNPGAANVFRTGNRGLGLLALILDISKAAAPVGFVYHQLGMRGIWLDLVAWAPMVGHAFSPFLRFRGGKALATVLGVWIGLTLWKLPLVAVGSVAIAIAFLSPPGWAVLVALGGILVALVVWIPDPTFFLVWAGQLLLLVWTHRLDLSQTPHLRSRKMGR